MSPNSVTKVLILSASPINEGRLRLDKERSDLDEHLKFVSNPKTTIEIVQMWAVRLDQIQYALQNSTPKILHFSGHGSKSAIYVEDKDGNSAEIPVDAMEGLIKLAAKTVECVVLSACYSKGMAERISKHVACVIGCDGSINDDAAIAFCRAFYRTLSHGHTYRESFEWAVNDVELNHSQSEARKYMCLHT